MFYKIQVHHGRFFTSPQLNQDMYDLNDVGG